MTEANRARHDLGHTPFGQPERVLETLMHGCFILRPTPSLVASSEHYFQGLN